MSFSSFLFFFFFNDTATTEIYTLSLHDALPILFAHVLGALDAEGAVRVDRDKVRLAAHELRLSAVQQTAVDRLEREFREAAAAPPSAEEALGRAGLAGDEEHELFQLLVESRKLVRVKESLFFHAAALEAIQDKLGDPKGTR